MALDQAAVLSKLRTRVAEVTGLERVYTQGESGANRMPAGMLEIPCAIVFAGATVDYKLGQATHSRTWEAHVDLFEGGADYGERGYNVLPLVQAIVEKMAPNLKLGTLATLIVLERDTGLITIDWGGTEYTGTRMTFRVTEHASAAPAPGA